MVITGIDEKSKNRSALSVDGVIKAWISNDLILERGLRIGDEISQSELDELISDNNREKTKNRALNILSYRDHSRNELERKLSNKGCAEDDTQEVLDRLCELGFVNDEAFAHRYYTELTSVRKYSVRRAKAELVKKGIDREIIENTVEEVAVDDLETLLALFSGKFRNKINNIEKRNTLAQSLMRNGFSWSDISSAFLRYDEEYSDE